MPELGETTDPLALVPGDPAMLFDVAWSLRVSADALDEAGGGLLRLGTPEGWRGEAAEQFRARFSAEPERWLVAGVCHRMAGDALESYAEVLQTSQSQAADAVERWTAAERPPGPAPPSPGQQEALALLADARARVLRAGETTAVTVAAARERAPEAPGFLADLATGAQAVVAEVGNAAASLGNAAWRHPLDGAALATGGLLAGVSAVGVVGGAGLTLTGPGAVAGVPLTGISAAGVAAGAGLAGLGAIDLALNAAGPDRVEPFRVDEDVEPATAPPFPPPREIAGMTRHGEEQVMGRDGGVGVSDEAMADAVADPVEAPQYQPGSNTYRYTGQDAVVILNEAGKVVTAWAVGRGGHRT